MRINYLLLLLLLLLFTICKILEQNLHHDSKSWDMVEADVLRVLSKTGIIT